MLNSIRELLKARLEIFDEDKAVLYYTCPDCGQDTYVNLSRTHTHLPFWKWVGGLSVDDLTVAPSIRMIGHIHFNITDGQLIDHKDEKHNGKDPIVP